MLQGVPAGIFAGLQKVQGVVLLSLPFVYGMMWASLFPACLDSHVCQMRMQVTSSIRGELEPLRLKHALGKLCLNGMTNNEGDLMAVWGFLQLALNFATPVCSAGMSFPDPVLPLLLSAQCWRELRGEGRR